MAMTKAYDHPSEACYDGTIKALYEVHKTHKSEALIDAARLMSKGADNKHSMYAEVGRTLR